MTVRHEESSCQTQSFPSLGVGAGSITTHADRQPAEGLVKLLGEHCNDRQTKLL